MEGPCARRGKQQAQHLHLFSTLWVLLLQCPAFPRALCVGLLHKSSAQKCSLVDVAHRSGLGRLLLTSITY